MRLKLLLLIILPLFVPSLCWAQGLFTDSIVEPYRFVEEMPEFPGGERSMNRFIIKNLEYPSQISQDSIIRGFIHIEFVVNKVGDIQDIKVTRSGGSALDSAAVAMIKKMPRWKPGKQNGIPVPVKLFLPIHFNIPGD